jgi:hypothetical protein
MTVLGGSLTAEAFLLIGETGTFTLLFRQRLVGFTVIAGLKPAYLKSLWKRPALPGVPSAGLLPKTACDLDG